MSRRFLSRTIAGSALVLVAAALPGLTSSPASADDAGTITMVGTSDVSDSGLIQYLTPFFEAADPQYTLNYVSLGTGAAIAQAEAGNASALLVHAASLENQFVGQGYSLGPFGRAIFYGDYVLLGPASDPAGVMNGSQHDIVGAFQKIAAAGALGDANFVSRGGTPGTTVQEHAIWALTTGVTTCNVSSANGGGTVPNTSTGDCPTPLTPPDWYHTTGLTQGPNIEAGDVCNFPTAAGGNNCYVLTDRGTFQFLESTNAISNLQIVVRDNTAPGQTTLLINSFHAYAINPDKFAGNPAVQINTAGATAFLDWVTSPAGQAKVASYLSDGGDPPFLPDAAPSITSDPLPVKVSAGQRVKLAGSIANIVPGTPPLNGIEVKLIGTQGGSTFTVTKTITGGKGKFTLSFHPKRTASYTLKTPEITKIEIPTLSPVFGDELQPATLSLGKVKVKASVTISKVKAASPKITLSGWVSPRDAVKPGRLQLWAGHPGDALTQMGTSRSVAVGSRLFSETFKLGSGTWRYQLRFTNAGVVSPGASHVRRVTLS